MTQGVFQRDLMCRIIRFNYDFETQECRLFLDAHNCTDMTGAINFAKAIDPDVLFVRTYERGQLDTCYRKEGEEWEASSRPTSERLAR